jgi:ubiquinone/menaquinone biosynthesis C-methylase UbiE
MIAKAFSKPVGIEEVQRLMTLQRNAFDVTKVAASKQGVDLMAERTKRYLTRWKEALVYAPEKACVLDIGPGWMVPQLYDLLIDKLNLNYHALDIDLRDIEDLADRVAAAGLPRSNFANGEISNLPFPKKFDLVFSSHCLEHAVDIVETLKEIRRVLKDGAHLFMSVPLGFDMSDEHLLFHSPSEWICMLTAVGFEVITSTVGNVYAETSDLTILARHNESHICDFEAACAVAHRFSKAGKTFMSHQNEVFSYSDSTLRGEEFSILNGIGTKCEITLPNAVHSLIVVRHSWSGCIKISDGNNKFSMDCYHHLHHLQGIDLSGFGKSLTIEVIGKNPISSGAQCAISGALIET